MGIELGRISGPLLARNLARKGSGLGEENLAFETNLLYLDVINGRIGIHTDSPSRELEVIGTTKLTNLITTTQLTTPGFVVSGNTIQNPLNKIYIQPNQSTDPKILTARISTDNLRVSDQLIENITNNSDINFNANGSGTVYFNTSELYVNGGVTVTGSVTWDGSLITLGSDDSDNVIFNADVNSSIIPNITDVYNLGRTDKRWNTLYVDSVSADALTFDSSTINNINLLLSQGNTIYVSVNGNDTYVGTHLHNTYRTVKHALSQAVAGDTVVIFPGTYQEDFPLVVPAGVTVTGAGIRAVSIVPTVGTNTNNAFLLNGETTVSNLTVKDFYQGYAFSFNPSFTVTTRSPYVQNVTVITTGPNAGNGALVDGALATNSSKEAGMLFHSVTMIIPGAVGITATNGARVEWLDCFTYYAEKGIYLTQGTLGFASLGLKFGAEMRSIGSANVYGTYGAVADGASTIGYLIGHNFGYIGTGTDSTNDQRLVIQANEIVELNNGRIYYESVDHKGDFRIGDIFYVNQDTGAVVFNAQSITFTPAGNITLTGPTSSAYIDYSMVEVGNIKIHDNNIDSLIGPVNFLAYSGNTYLNTNVTVTGNTNITADVKVKGNIWLGDTPYDTITVFPQITQDLLPDDVGGPFTLGTSPARWNTLYATGLNVDGVTQITNNTISTLTSGTNLQLVAAGTGLVKITNTDVQISNNLTVAGATRINGNTSLRDISLLGGIGLTGNINQTGNTYITGTFANNNISITGNSYFQVPNIRISGNTISAQATNNNLVFQANNTGGVILENRLKFKDNELSNVWISPANDTQKSIIFAPNGTGNLVVNSSKSVVLPVGNNSNRTIGTGEIRYNNVTNLIEGGATAGLVSFNGLYDSDRNTYVTVGATNNTFTFGINGTAKATLSPTALVTDTYFVDNVRLTGNTISNRIADDDLLFAPTGTGNTLINNIGVHDSSIINFANSAITLQSSGNGFIKFTGTGAIIFPQGPEAARRLTPETGETRFNTDRQYLEVFDGTQWIPSVGTNGAVDALAINGLLDIWTIILG